MKKTKLIEARNAKGLSQHDIANLLFMHDTCYCKRENGETKITLQEWIKLSEILHVQINDIYEDDNDNQTFVNNQNAIGNIFGAPIFNIIPMNLLETLLNYIKKQDIEIAELNKENSELRKK